MADDIPENNTIEQRIANELNEYAVKPSQLVQILKRQLPKRSPIMIWGAMGLGKTEIVWQVSKEWGFRVLALHLALFDPTDLKGIPIRDENGRILWVPYSALPKEFIFRRDKDFQVSGTVELTYDAPFAEDMAVFVYDTAGNLMAAHNLGMEPDLVNEGISIRVNDPKSKVTISLSNAPAIRRHVGSIVVTEKATLFLDELSAAHPQVQNAALSLVLDRRINDYVLPMLVPIVGAGNREIDMAYVHRMSAPLANRFNHLRLVPDLKDFIREAIRRNTSPYIIGFVESRGLKALFNFQPAAMKAGDMAFTTPRAWIKLDGDMDGEWNEPKPVRDPIIAGRIGKAMAREFIAFVDTMGSVKIDDILTGKVIELNPDDLDDPGKLMFILMAIVERVMALYDENGIGKMAIKSLPADWNKLADNILRFIDRTYQPEYISYVIGKFTQRTPKGGISKSVWVTFSGAPYYEPFAERHNEVLKQAL